MSRSGRLILGAVIAAGAVLGAAQITSGSTTAPKNQCSLDSSPPDSSTPAKTPTTFDGFDQAVGRLDAGTTYELDIAGRAGIPTDALSVTANLVAVNPSAPGHLTVYPCGFDKPLASALNYMPGVNNANEFTVPLGDNGDICIYAYAETDIVVDIYGYYIAGSGGTGEQGPAGQDGADGRRCRRPRRCVACPGHLGCRKRRRLHVTVRSYGLNPRQQHRRYAVCDQNRTRHLHRNLKRCNEKLC